MTSQDCVNGVEPNAYVSRCADTNDHWGTYVTGEADTHLQPGVGSFVHPEQPGVRPGAYTDSAHQ
jgi:hypothetical protein